MAICAGLWSLNEVSDAQSLTGDQSTDLSSLDEVLAKNGQELEHSLTKTLTVSTHHTLDQVVEDSRARIVFESHVHTQRLETSPQDSP